MPSFDIPGSPPEPPQASPQHFETIEPLPAPVQALEAINVEGETLLVPARPKVSRGDKPKAVRSKVNQEAEKDVSK